MIKRLASLGHSVIGIEISQLACEQFFNENNMKYSKINLQEFILYLVKFLNKN